MDWVLFTVILVVILALVFDFTNGFHDAGNAIATVVATKVLSPRTAVIFGAVLNFVGALLGTEVAATIGKGLVDQQFVQLHTVVACLISAIAWNFFTWHRGLPTSSSHALVGSLIGATIFASSDGYTHVHFDNVVAKVIVPMLSSPLIGFIIGFTLMTLLAWAVYQMSNERIRKVFGKLQILSAGLMALSHGHNDAQKSMGIIALALIIAWPQPDFTVPLWVIISCAICMGAGTLVGGWRIIRTLSSKLIKLQTIHGFAAETTSAGIIMGVSHFGIPVSTTQIITSSIMGVGATKRLGAVRWTVVGNIIWAWVLTLPCTILFSGLVTMIINTIF